jgi:GR25 family glycosyltransferase involved in LPS biosynthesis
MNIFKHFVFVISLMFCSVSFAKLEDHFKQATGKGDHHKMRNIDFIYMINLDKRPEKYAMSINQFEKYGIYPYRFSAVNGWELSIDDINDVGLKYKKGMTPLMATTYLPEANGKPTHEKMSTYGRTYFCHCMAPGAIGCALSHISVLQDAYDSGYEVIWVMEDDVEVLSDPNILSDLIDDLNAVVGKKNWDVLFTDYNYRIGVKKYLPAYGAAKRPDMDCSDKERFSRKYTKSYAISKNFRSVSARFGTHSMIISRSGIKKLLSYAKTHNIYLPYDLDNYLIPGIKRYALKRDIVTNMLGSISDIGVNHPGSQEIISKEEELSN